MKNELPVGTPRANQYGTSEAILPELEDVKSYSPSPPVTTFEVGR
jgi:hypothetical protein